MDYNGLLYSSVPYASAPSQAVNFVASHDGYTVIDKLRLSVKGDHADDELPPIDKLIHTILLTAQGVPFIRAGEEMMQDKQGEPNSFRSPDAVNRIDWALKAKNRDLFDYVRGLIALPESPSGIPYPDGRRAAAGASFPRHGDSGVSPIRWANMRTAMRGKRFLWPITATATGRVPHSRSGLDRSLPRRPDRSRSRDRMPGGIVRIAPSSAIIAYRE